MELRTLCTFSLPSCQEKLLPNIRCSTLLTPGMTAKCRFVFSSDNSQHLGHATIDA